MNEEPSVLDYLKSKLFPWKYPAVELPEPLKQPDVQAVAAYPGEVVPDSPQAQNVAAAPIEEAAGQPVQEPAYVRQPEAAIRPESMAVAAVWPWRSLAALGLALLAQVSLEPEPGRTWTVGAGLYFLAGFFLVWAIWRQEWLVAPLPKVERQPDALQVNGVAALIGLVLSASAYLALGGNRFTPFNVLLWLAAFLAMLRAFWLGKLVDWQWLARVRSFLARARWNIPVSGWTLVVFGVAALAVFYHFYQLNQVPPEMNSDHAEKLLDVADVLSGQTRIFFPRNTGREPMQFYLTAAIASLLGTGVSFTSLKIGTGLAALFTLPFIYLLGKEIGNKYVGLFATAFAAVAYWPNVIARIALRFALYPAFVAPSLYFLARGLRRSSRNDFILSGIFLGIGLHGYTPIRILPFVIVAAVAIYLLHRQSAGVRKRTIIYLGVLALISLVIFLPLLRFAQSNPELFAFRAFTRLSDWERPLSGPALKIFIGNLWNALTMFNWDNGEVWTVSIPHRPALGVVTGALFLIGALLVLVRYLRNNHWLDLFLLLSIPMLMLPSILSLAFPSENPVLSRTSGALIPAFILVGIALEGLFTSLKKRVGGAPGRWVAWAVFVLLLAWSGLQNYDLVFHQYYQEYKLSAWNTSEMGAVIKEFDQTVGNIDHAWVVGYPYWVDTRLVGMNAGYPYRDTVILQDQLESTATDNQAKLFLVKPEDAEAILTLNRLYPQGSVKEYHSEIDTKDFLMFFVPPG